MVQKGFPYYVISHLYDGQLKNWMHVASSGIGSRKFDTLGEADSFFRSIYNEAGEDYEEKGFHVNPLSIDQYCIIEHADSWRSRIVRVYEGEKVTDL